MKIKIALLFSFLCAGLFGQTIIGVDTLLKTGPINKRINLVIMGDGYTNAQIPQFLTNANSIYTYLLSTPPFNNYQNYFNVFAIKCASPQSGVTHAGTATDVTEPASPVMTVTNYFDTQFDNYNIHRLIYSNDQATVYSVLSANFPAYDQVIILGNSTEYGGAGGAYAVSSIHSSSKEIVAHEMGHSFAGLADEYWAGASYAAEKPNMTANSNTTTVKWAPWLGINSTGVYAHGTSSPENGWFRPHQNCKMRYLNSPFCSVCQQTIIEKIHSLTNPIDAYSPANTGTVGAQWFKTKLVKPNPNTLKRNWMLNSTVILNNVDSVLINSSALTNGNNSLTFTAIDTTGLSKDATHASLHSFSVVWTINANATGIKEIKPQMEYSIYPNPATDIVNIKYNVLEAAQISMSVTDVSGKTVKEISNTKETAGEHIKEVTVSELTPGIYFLTININGQNTNHKFVIFK